MRAGKPPPTFDELAKPLHDDLVEFDEDTDYATDRVFTWRLLRTASTHKLALLSRMSAIRKSSDLFKLLKEDDEAKQKKFKEDENKKARESSAADSPQIDRLAKEGDADEEELPQQSKKKAKRAGSAADEDEEEGKEEGKEEGEEEGEEEGQEEGEEKGDGKSPTAAAMDEDDGDKAQSTADNDADLKDEPAEEDSEEGAV